MAALVSACRRPIVWRAAANFGGVAARCFSIEISYMERRSNLESMSGRERFSAGRVRELRGIPSLATFLGPMDPAQRDLFMELKQLGNNKQWQEALTLYGTVREPSPHVRYMALMACTKAFQAEKAWQIFSDWSSPPLPVYNIMIGMLSRSRHLREVEELVHKLKEQGLEPNYVTYTGMIQAYGTAGDSESAMRCFEEMESKGLAASEVEYGATLGACGKSGDYARAAELLLKMDTARVEPHVGHFTSLMLSCSSSKDGARAQAAFAELKKRGITPDVVAYTCLASCLAGPEGWARVQELRSEMEVAGLRPHVFFYAELLRLASEAQETQRFQELLQEMDERGVARNSKIEQRIFQMQRMEQRREEMNEGGLRYESAAASQSPQPDLPSPPPLPAGWQQAPDPSTGRFYYWKEADPSNTVTWERPA